MWIEINAGGRSSDTRTSARKKFENIDTKGKTFRNTIGEVFWSYEYALQQNGMQKVEWEWNVDISFERVWEGESGEITITVSGNKLRIANILAIAPNQLSTTLVQKALALGKITLPPQIARFIQPIGIVGGDLSAIIMGRHIHVTPEWEIWTPPKMMIPGPDTWHKVKPTDIFNLILPDWLHRWVESVSMNTSVESWVLECITWKKQKIRIRPNGEISQVIDKAEFTIDRREHINLVIPDCLIGKISFNGDSDHLPLFGTVWYVGDKEANEYICIKPGGIVEKMGKPGGWKECSAGDIQRLWRYPSQEEIKKITQQRNQDAIRQLVKQLKALQN